MSSFGLSNIYSRYRKKIVFTYLLFTVEFTLFLLAPFALGVAIDSLLKGSYNGIYILIGQHLTHLFVSRARRLYDTRTFTRIYNDIAVLVINHQKINKVADSTIIAQSSLTKDLINFFEHDITTLFNCAYSVIGSLIVLSFYDIKLVLFCLLLVVPCAVLNYYFNNKYNRYYKLKNSELEKQVNVITQQPAEAIKRHYKKLARLDIKISDLGAINFTIMEFFVLTLIISSLIYYCQAHMTAGAGTILAVFQYIIKFIVGLDSIPGLNSQIANIKDIQNRIKASCEDIKI
ncbi:ABC transporter six-transmembrane domain-containing protein [Chitinophaga sp. 30R24]|uniref:ABC transporter six-transmembrane domain-containing protein n=1 Tax=Chitinophaga sp. 30R24 TaxID=3248838 RepID=UPI003B909DA6